ncbi:MAG: hypothetical protein JWN55_1502 [Frankiales bacterium]|jgi:hypothetical protein|nr:hypothetical protein [Frankiales bacterium]
MPDNGGVTVTQTPPAPPAKSRRGRETALDMVRSLGVVFLLVLPLWFFGQASPQDSKAIRPVDPREALTAFAETTGGPVPTTPAGWVVNVRDYQDGVVRVGYVLGEHYTEFQGGLGAGFLDAATGKGKRVGTVDVGGVAWQRWASPGDHESLVRTVGRATVLVGGIREDATLDELKALAATVS